jgi:6-methylsalicylate decarboxylase
MMRSMVGGVLTQKRSDRLDAGVRELLVQRELAAGKPNAANAWECRERLHLRPRTSAARPSHRSAGSEWTPQKAIDAMDAAGIATAVTSISAPGIWFGDRAATRELARECNEFAADLMHRHRNRFGMFAVLPFPNVDDCLAEIDYAFGTLKADGIGMVTSFGNMWPGDKTLEPVFNELNRRRTVVYVHPTCSDSCTGLLPGVQGPMIEFPFDTTRAIVSLLTSGTFARCHNIRFIFSHGGGALPMLAARIAAQVDRHPDFSQFLPNGAMSEFARHHYDIATVCNPISFDALCQIAPSSRLLFGSDYPYQPAEPTLDGLANLGLDEKQLRMIERDNALELLTTLKARVGIS